MKRTAALTVLVFLGSVVQAQSNNAIGVWLDDKRESKIKVTQCGKRLCGTIVWLVKPMKDDFNVDASKRGRDLIGVQIFNNLVPDGPNSWIGTAYSPRKGKVYSGSARVNNDRLTLKGCLTSARILCQTVKFTRDK